MRKPDPAAESSKCPRCRSTDVVPICYGLPGPEAVEASGRGEIVLGGCVVIEGSPEWQCRRCGARWGAVMFGDSVDG